MSKIKFLLLSSTVLGFLQLETSAMQNGEEENNITTTTPIKQNKQGSQIQLEKVADDRLEAVLGTGNKVLLKISMSLEPLKGLFNKEQLEVLTRLFLTDFKSSPTNHPAIDLNVKVDCEPIIPTYTLPNKPQSFDRYDQFTHWLNQGYFTNQLNITYDFHIDPHALAPSLVQHLFPFSVSPGGYHINGAHIIHNAKITPDDCVPKVVYVSKRDHTNATTATMGGTLHLNKKSYLIDDHQQTFPHPKINEIVFKRDETKKFHSHKWLTQSETITKVTYTEFPNDQIQNWPNAPSGTYSLLRKQREDVGKNDHIACWDGNSGKEVDIEDGRIFSVVYDAINSPIVGSHFLESIVKDNAENLYTIRYKATTINDLPNDLLNRIFINLETHDLNSIAQVSKLFNNVASKILHNVRENVVLAIRESMIDECINSCKMFTAPIMTYSQLYYGFVNVFPLYDKRKRYNTEKGIKDDYLDNALNSWWYPQYKDKFNLFESCKTINLPFPALNTPEEAKGVHDALKTSFQAFKEDVIESMNIYERLRGRAHPRKEEVEKMIWPERAWW